MYVRRQARRWTVATGLALLVACGCRGDAEDMCRRVKLDDENAYVQEVVRFRSEREEAFRQSPESPVPESLRETWEGLDHYPPDPRWAFEGPLVRRVSPRTFQFAVTTGEPRPGRQIGYFRLPLETGPFDLPVYELDESPGYLFLPLLDTTTSVETYPAGRYLEVEESSRGTYRVDFNYAYNPTCAYGTAFSCPIAPEESRLPVAVRAGERGLGIDYEEVAPTPDG